MPQAEPPFAQCAQAGSDLYSPEEPDGQGSFAQDTETRLGISKKFTVHSCCKSNTDFLLIKLH